MNVSLIYNSFPNFLDVDNTFCVNKFCYIIMISMSDLTF